jgi:hypothetical protein
MCVSTVLLLIVLFIFKTGETAKNFDASIICTLLKT